MCKHIGYVWPGMCRISYAEAKELLSQGIPVFHLYDDNSEGEIRELDELNEDGQYGIEFGNSFTFERYVESNADNTGFTCFCHGTANPKILLELTEEFLDLYQHYAPNDSVEKNIQQTWEYIRNTKPDTDDAATCAVWQEVVRRINTLIPDGWQFGNFRNNGVDYGFIRNLQGDVTP